MKKSTIYKVAAGIGLLFIAAHFLNERKKKQVAAVAATVTAIPEKFDIADGENTKKYWIEKDQYMYQLTGPTIKSQPSVITKADYESAYIVPKA